MYRDLEQEVKDAEPEKVQKTTITKAVEAEPTTAAPTAAADGEAITRTDAVAAEATAMAATAALTAAADDGTITKNNAEAAEATDASEAQETKGKDKEIIASYKNGR